MSDLPQKLLGYPRLLADESLASFLTRVGKTNFYQPPSILTELILDGIGEAGYHKDRVDLPRQVAVFERIARLAQIEVLQLYEASAHSFANVITPPGTENGTLNLPGNYAVSLLPRGVARKQLRSASMCQYCPLCLQQQLYHRRSWLPVAISTCLEHHCLLVNCCYHCSRPVRTQEVVNASCDRCGADLRKAPPVHIDSDELGSFAQRVLHGWLLNIPVSLPGDDFLPLHPPRVLFRLVDGLRFTTQRLGALGWPYSHILPTYHDSLKVPFGTSSHPLTPYQSYCVFTTALKAIVEWPNGFYEFLDAQYDQSDISMHLGSIYKDLGSMYSHWFQRRWNHPAFDFVQDAFNLYATKRYGASLSILQSKRFRQDPALFQTFSYISVNRAAELTGLAPSSIQRFINSGQLKTMKENSTFVRQEAVFKLRDSWDFLIGLEESAQMLGISGEIVLDMVNIGLLSPKQSPVTGFLFWQFDERDLRQLINKVKSHTSIYFEESEANVPFIGLVTAAKILTKIGLNTALIIAYISEGKLQAHRQLRSTFNFRDLLFGRSDLNACIEAIKAEQGWMSREEVTKRLKIKDATLAKWVRAGLLAPHILYKNVQYFDKARVEQFISDHIRSEQAANLLGIGTLTVQSWTRQGRLQAISGPGIDECHQYLFNKDRLVQWRNERLSFRETMNILHISAATLHRWTHEGEIAPLDDMGGKQRWFSRESVLKLQRDIEQKFASKEQRSEDVW